MVRPRTTMLIQVRPNAVHWGLERVILAPVFLDNVATPGSEISPHGGPGCLLRPDWLAGRGEERPHWKMLYPCPVTASVRMYTLSPDQGLVVYQIRLLLMQR